MSATLTLTAAEAAAIERGWVVYRNATDSMWPVAVRRHVGDAIEELHEALVIHGLVVNEDIHPVAAYDDIEPGDQAYDQAIAKGARDVADLTAELIRVFPACKPAARAREEEAA